MKNFRKFLTAPLMVLAAMACSKAPAADSGTDAVPEIDLSATRFTVNADVPETKTTFSGEQLVWEGTESIGLLIGDDNSTSSNPASRLSCELQTADGKPGVFAGTVDFGSFSTDNIHAIVCPFDASHYYYSKSAAVHRIAMTVAVAPQSQLTDNVLNGANTPLFCPLSSSDLFEKDGGYVIEGKAFRWGCALVRFNVYGDNDRMGADEVLRSITLHSTTGTRLAGTCEFTVEQNAFAFNGVAGDAVVSLTQECTIKDKTADDGIKVFMALLPRGEYSFSSGSYVIVSTDKHDYKMAIGSSTKIVLDAGAVRKIGLNLSKFTIVRETTPNVLPETTWEDEELW